MIQPAFEILNQRGTPMFFSDVLANRPTFGIVGRIFIATDSPYGLFRDTGTAWVQIAGSGGGGISGSGAAGQVTFWSGASAVSGSNNLWWDNATNKFLVGTNNATGGGAAQITNTTGDDHLRVWGSTSPSIRIDNAVSAATQRFAIGLATATNNFIQGSAAGNICITTASANPLLFGMWQTTNATEVMRISTGSNLLIGGTTDSGEKLQVTGNAKITGATTINASTSGSGGVSLIVTDTNSTVGTTAKFSFQTTDFIINTGLAGTNISNQSRSYIGFLAGSNRLTLGGSNSNSGMTGVNAIGNSDLGNGLGFAIVDVGGQIGQGSGLNFYSQQVSRTTGSIRQSYGAGFSNVDMLFLVSTSSTISEAMRIFGSSKNLGINTTTDAGWKMDIAGTFRSNMSGTGAGNVGFNVVSGSTNYLRIFGSGKLGIGSNSFEYPQIYSTSTTASSVDLNGQFISFSINNGTTQSTANSGGFCIISGNDSTITSGIYNNVFISKNFAPTSGTGVHNQLIIQGTINQTGGASGVSRGVYIAPTITSASDWRTIEWTNNSGFGLYGSGTAPNYLNGNLNIASTSNPGQKLYVNGSVRIDGQSSGTAGGNSGLHLIVNLDGTNYKIALLNV
jgi:fibronectin-binding autotransporter adhesin